MFNLVGAMNGWVKSWLFCVFGSIGPLWGLGVVHAASGSSALAEGTGQAGVGVTGVYRTTQGELTLYQTDAGVVGDWTSAYYSRPAHLQGMMRGGTLTGTTEMDGVVQPFSLTFQLGGRFEGTFANTYGAPVHWKGWLELGAIRVRLMPREVELSAGSLQVFKTQVAGSANPGCTFTVTGGSVAPNGTFTAPDTPGTYQITARSLADPSQSDTAVIQVVVPGPADLSGRYHSDHGTLTLFQEGKAYVGSWDDAGEPGGAQVHARVTGWTLSGTALVRGQARSFRVKVLPEARGFEGVYLDSQGAQVVWKAIRQAGAVIQIWTEEQVLSPGSTTGLDVRVGGVANKGFTITATGGKVDRQGRFMAPKTPGRYVVTATSKGDPTQKAQVVLLVTPDGRLDLSGRYTTDLGPLTLQSDATGIHGTWENAYEHRSVAVTGTLAGRTFHGAYLLDGEPHPVSLEFAVEGSTFEGTFQNRYGGTVRWRGSRQVP